MRQWPTQRYRLLRCDNGQRSVVGRSIVAMANVALQVVALRQWRSLCCRSQCCNDGQRCGASSYVTGRSDGQCYRAGRGIASWRSKILVFFFFGSTLRLASIVSRFPLPLPLFLHEREKEREKGKKNLLICSRIHHSPIWSYSS